jgi:hypothetical protein
MKDILCPVGSTSRTEGSIQYLGNLAHDTHAKVVLVSTEPARQKVMAISGTHFDTEARPSKVAEVTDFLNAKMHVPSGIEPDTLAPNDYKKLGNVASRHDMMMVPISSARQDAALDLNKIINETRVPIFLIPDEFKYRKIKCLIYAYDVKHEPEPPLKQLSQLASWFGADVRFISVFTKDAVTKERDLVHNLHVRLLQMWKGGTKISFDTIVYPQIPKFEEQYLGQPEQGDIQVISVSHQNFLDRLLHRGVVDGIQHSKYPYVIIHK